MLSSTDETIANKKYARTNHTSGGFVQPVDF